MTQRVFAFGANESAGELQLGGARVEYDSRVLERCPTSPFEGPGE
jgi:hypothetical protein